MQQRGILLVSRLSRIRMSSSPALYSTQTVSKYPSFTTTGSVERMIKSVPLKTMLLILSTGHPQAPGSKLSETIDITEFCEGSKKAIEVVSEGLSRGDLSQLNDLLTNECFQKVENILQEGLSADKDLYFLAVRKENIFLHFISEAKISDDLTQIDLGKP